jgi:putative methionine-R-sulfoxide reductase with GAF domain
MLKNPFQLPESMSETKPSTQGQNDINVQRAFGGALILTAVAFASVVLAAFSASLFPVWQAFLMVAIAAISLTVDAISVVLIRRGQAALGLKILYWSVLITLPLNVLLLSGVTTILMGVLLMLGFVVVFLLFPPAWRKYLQFGPLVSVAVMFLIDFVAPFFRLDMGLSPFTRVVGPLVLVLAIVGIVITFLAWVNLRLRTKLIAVFIAVALIPLAIITFLNDRNTRQILTDETNTTLLAAASTTATQLDTFITQGLTFVGTQAQLPDFVAYLSLPASERADNADEVTAILSVLTQQDPTHISSISLLDRQGNALLDTFTADIGTNKADRDYFKAAIQTGQPYASEVEFSRTTGDASIYFAAPVRDESGKIIGVFRIRYNASILQEYIAANVGLVGANSYPVLLNANHVRLAEGNAPALIFKSIVPLDAATVSDLQAKLQLPPGSPQELSTDLPGFEAGVANAQTQPFFAAELEAEANTGTAAVEDTVLEQAAVAPMKTQSWVVVFAQSQDVFLAPINTQARNNIVLALIIGVVVALFGLFMAQTLAGPIVRLTKVAETVSGGDINAQAQVESKDEIGTLATAFNSMTAQLRDFIATLEQRVEARTKDLATVAEVGTATATILETDRLLQEVVDLTKERFNLYHSHIYLLDEAGENLVLASGAGEPGRQMKAKGLSIPLNREQSLVARAARERKGVTINDVTQAPDFLPNPLLPDTRSELATPMIVGGRVIGVFDVQSDLVDRFTDSDINIQTTLAAQVAISIQNVRLFEQSKTQAELESRVNAISQKIQRAATVEETLQTAIREIGTALGAQRVKASIARHISDGNESSNN